MLITLLVGLVISLMSEARRRAAHKPFDGNEEVH
jgi:hypothetical protein